MSLSVTSSTITLHPGDKNVPVNVSVTSSSYTGPVSITLTGLPSGISVAPLTLATGSSGTLLVSASISAGQEEFPATGPSLTTTRSKTISLVGIGGGSQSTLPMTLGISISNPNFLPTAASINLPILKIDTGGVAIVDKTTNIPGTITITSADGQTAYLPNSDDTDNTATFHLHGNSTVDMPKKPYHVKLNTSLDLLSTMGVTCPYVTSKGKEVCDKSKSYILLANYDDKTFLRDWAASALANAIPIGNGYLDSPAISPSPSGSTALMPWAPHSLFVELFLNGAYEGNYQLIEEVKVDSHRVNINELAETDTNDDVTGGYLMEIDARKDEAYVFTTPAGYSIGLIDPDFTPDPEVPEQTAYISGYVTTAENALFSSNYKEPVLGWRAYFDEASAVNFYLVNELMGNVDGGEFFSSDYIYKDKDNPLIYMGPVWDFDISSGNVNYQAIVNPTASWVQSYSKWYRQLFRDPGFKADAAAQWNRLKSNGVLSTWLNSVNQQASSLQQSQANNFTRWPMLGIPVWPNPVAIGSYSGEVNYFTNWLGVRMGYLDSILNNKLQTTTSLSTPSGTLRQGSAVTLNARVTGGAAPAGNISFLSNGIVLGAASANGTGNASFITNSLPAGTDVLEAVYVGDGKNALSASTAISKTVLAPLVTTVTALSSSVSSASIQTPVTLTAVVVANAGTASPTGSVTFFANTKSIGSVAVGNNGVAVFSTSQLGAGADSIQASYGGDVNYQGSASNSVSVSVSTVPAPVFSLPTGTYPGSRTVTITDAAAAAVIHYTVNGSMPTGTSAVYTNALSVTSTETLKAIAVVAGSLPSGTTSATYTITSTAGAINFSNGFAGAQGPITFNGSAKLDGSRLRLTDGGSKEAGSAFYATPVGIGMFSTNFTFQITSPAADGFTFTIQGVGPSALGANGGGLGYFGIGKSVALKFDLFGNAGEGADSTGLYTEGAAPTLPSVDLTNSGINLHSGDSIQAHITYDGTSLAVTLTDLVTSASWSKSFSVDIPSLVGGTTAYVGFTGGTGGQSSIQDLLGWSYIPGPQVVPNYPVGFDGSGLTLNGAALFGTALQLTNGGSNQANSAYYSTPVGVQAFTARFDFQDVNAVADGFTFVIQNSGPNAVGIGGGYLGYGNIPKSVAIKFDIFDNLGEGSDSTGVYTNGAAPAVPSIDLTPSKVILSSGDVIHAHIVYDGTTLTWTISDSTLPSHPSATHSMTINIPSIVGGNTAYVGFTGGTGGATAVQNILDWTMSVP